MKKESTSLLTQYAHRKGLPRSRYDAMQLKEWSEQVIDRKAELQHCACRQLGILVNDILEIYFLFPYSRIKDVFL